jgi:hypothetical protein
MKKTREERRAFLDRIEKKYKEKLLLLNYKEESESLQRQLSALKNASVDKLDPQDLLEVPTYRATTS